jgi:hypothetical protein
VAWFEIQIVFVQGDRQFGRDVQAAFAMIIFSRTATGLELPAPAGLMSLAWVSLLKKPESNYCFQCCHNNYFQFCLVWICIPAGQGLKQSHTQRLDQLAHWRRIFAAAATWKGIGVFRSMLESRLAGIRNNQVNQPNK